MCGNKHIWLNCPGKDYETIEDGTVERLINPSCRFIDCGHPVEASDDCVFLKSR